MNKIKNIIYDWQNLILKTEGIKRKEEDLIFDSFGSKPIKVITGFRRAGKSYLTRLLVKRAVNSGLYKLNNIFFLNFEDYGLSKINNAEKLGDLYNVFKNEIADLNGKKLLIFDEIHLVKNWDKFLRTIYEKEDNIEIIITGSNSELLSSEIGSNLAGRFIEFFLLPFSFNEFLEFKKVLPTSLPFYYQNKNKIDFLFNEFISYGGLPEIFLISSTETKLSYIEGVFNKVILDDIIKRFSLDNIEVFEKLAKYLLANTGNQISFSKIANKIKVFSGINVKAATLIKYSQYLVKAFSLFEVNKFDWKQNKFFSQSRKFYAVDTGLLSLFRSERENYSFRLENLVFLELLRRKKEIAFGMNQHGKELDFLIKEKNGKINEKIQVCIDLNVDNYNREISSFVTADKFLKNTKNTLLTFNQSELLFENKIKINKINIIEWLLFDNFN